MMHRLLSISAVLIALLIMPKAFAQLDCMGVDGGTALPGTPCDNGNVNNTGFPDIWLNDCTCHDYCDAGDTYSGYPGDVCDDNDATTVNDLIWPGCICSGICMFPGTPGCDCNGLPFGTGFPGTPCDDGDPSTSNDTWSTECVCIGGWNVISGTIFLDLDGDGIYNGSDVLVPNRMIQASPAAIFTSTSDYGEFVLYVPPGTYSLLVEPGSFDQQAQSPPQIEVQGLGGISSENHIALSALDLQPDISVVLSSSPPRPGFSNYVTAIVMNNGTLPTEVELTFIIDPLQELWTPWQFDEVVGNVATHNIGSVGIGQMLTIWVYGATPDTVAPGTWLEYSVIAETTLTDPIVENNSDSCMAVVVASCDPNDKIVDPSTITPQEVTESKPVEYTIRFQNTGTYLAETVRIEDQLSEDLDLSTFEFLGSSHPCTWSIDNGMLEFYFEEIMLPDSNANEPESHGFVMFRITPNNDLMLGDVVENSAAIYFDFNEPIITEPAVFAVETSTGISDQETEEIKLWPNPSTGILQVEFTGSATGDLVVLDLLGRPVHQQRISIGTTSMDLSDLASGNYIVQIDSPERPYRSRFVKK